VSTPIALPSNGLANTGSKAALKTYSSDGRESIGRNLLKEFSDAVYDASPYVEHSTLFFPSQPCPNSTNQPISGFVTTSAYLSRRCGGVSPHKRRSLTIILAPPTAAR
jgi:hypothetical protein